MTPLNDLISSLGIITYHINSSKFHIITTCVPCILEVIFGHIKHIENIWKQNSVQLHDSQLLVDNTLFLQRGTSLQAIWRMMLDSAGQSVDDDPNSETQADQRPPLTLWVNNACPPHEPLVITTLRVNVSATILQMLFKTAKFEIKCFRNVQQWYNYNTKDFMFSLQAWELV